MENRPLDRKTFERPDHAGVAQPGRFLSAAGTRRRSVGGGCRRCGFPLARLFLLFVFLDPLLEVGLRIEGGDLVVPFLQSCRGFPCHRSCAARPPASMSRRWFRRSRRRSGRSARRWPWQAGGRRHSRWRRTRSTVSGVQTSQSPLRKCRSDQSLHSWRRSKLCTESKPLPRGMVSSRICGKLAETTSSWPSFTLLMGNSMLLWPPRTQTSPTRMLSSVRVLVFALDRHRLRRAVGGHGFEGDLPRAVGGGGRLGRSVRRRKP